MSEKTPKVSKPTRFEQQWQYRPAEPIRTSPLFELPLNIKSIVLWIANRWFVFGENVIVVGLAVLTWFYLQPPLEQTQQLEFGWIAKMYVRNFVLICLVAGGLHYLLHVRKSQGEKLKFDPRELKDKGKKYSFNNQLRDNIFWTLASGVFFWTAYEALMLWSMANGYVPKLLWSEHPIWFVLLFFLSNLWISFHFYWIHRFLHWPPMYKLAHALHHRNTNIGPWSGFSMHPIEHLLFLSSVLIHWIVAAHPIHIIYHLQHQALTAATSHAGFENFLIKDKQRLALGNFHHQMHHRYFDCNYGNLEVPWDKLFGSFHDGTNGSHEEFLSQRRKRLV